MQPHGKSGAPIGPPEPFDQKKMEGMLKKPDVDYVRVFRLKKGDTFKLEGHLFEVTKVMGGGRAMIKKQV